MAFEITFLGTGAASPTLRRGLSAAIVNVDETLCLIDCGEGTQMQMLRFGIKKVRIRHVFISHLHGDHYFGLVGLLFSWHLHQRKDELHVWGPFTLKEILEIQIKTSVPNLCYPLVFHDLESMSDGVICIEKNFTVSKFPLNHRLSAFGFLVKEIGRQGNISKDFIKKYHPDPETIRKIKDGTDFKTNEGIIIPHTDIVSPVRLHSFAWCSDTAYHPPVVENVTDADVLYHEATFMKNMQWLAEEKGHSTTIDAALIASQAKVHHLILGHISQRYTNLEEFVNEARNIFPHTDLAFDGMKIKLRN